MKTEVLPAEIQEIAKGVSVEKRNEVQNVLNKVFDGVSKMREQLDSIVVEDENDKVNMKLANTIRLGVKAERLAADKIFNAKRSELKQLMLSHKVEDSLWFKAKQVKDILSKEVEENARWKEETAKRFEAEQKEIKIKQRENLINKFNPEILRSEFENMGDETFNTFLSGIEKSYNDKIEAEKAEAKRIEDERIEKEKEIEENRKRQLLHNERKNKLTPLWSYVPLENQEDDFSDYTEKEFKETYEYFSELKSINDAKIESQRVENERLKKEAELKEKELKKANELREKRSKELQPYIVFIRDYSKLISKDEVDYVLEFNEIKEVAQDHWEFERTEQIRKQKEAEIQEAKAKKERERQLAEKEELKKQQSIKDAKIKAEYQAKLKESQDEQNRIQDELKAKQKAEEKALKEAEEKKQTELSKCDQDKVEDLISDLKALKTKYSFSSKSNKDMYSKVNLLIDKVIAYI